MTEFFQECFLMRGKLCVLGLIILLKARNITLDKDVKTYSIPVKMG